VPLSDYDLLEQVDLIEAEKRMVLADFGKEVVRIYAMAKDPKEADKLVSHLRKVYFVDESDAEKHRLKKQADELISMTQSVFKVRKTAFGAAVEISNKEGQ
jgi:hypothetical protein